MTVPTVRPPQTYDGNDSTTVFDYDFELEKEVDLTVKLLVVATDVETTLILNTDYSISGVGEAAGGSITYPITGDPLATGESITLQSDPDPTQDTNLRNQGGFYPENVEDMIDRAFRCTQNLTDLVNRSMRLPVTDDSGASAQLPTPVASKLIAWASDALSLVNADFIDSVFVSQESAPTTDGTILLWHKPSTGILYYLNSTPAWAAVEAGTGDMQSVNNLSELANIVTARTNLGINGFYAKNAIINGDMRIAQRGSSFVAGVNDDSDYTLDRWYILSDGNDIVDVTQETSVIPTNGLNAIALDVETINKKFGIAQIIEQKNCIGLIGNTVTLSFQAKVSSTTKLDNVKCAIISWDSTADAMTSDFVSAWGIEGTNPTLVANCTYENAPANLSLTTSYAAYTVSAAIDTASAANIALLIWSDVTDTTLGDFLYITDVQLENGAANTAFERRPFQQELALCQRYLPAFNSTGTTSLLPASGGATSTTACWAAYKFGVPTRVTPTGIVVSSAGHFEIEGAGGGGETLTTVTVGTLTSKDSFLLSGTVASGLTAGRAYVWSATSASGQILFTGCEL